MPMAPSLPKVEAPIPEPGSVNPVRHPHAERDVVLLRKVRALLDRNECGLSEVGRSSRLTQPQPAVANAATMAAVR